MPFLGAPIKLFKGDAPRFDMENRIARIPADQEVIP
jgi:hypothetical protein